MKLQNPRSAILLLMLVVGSLATFGCTNDFYLSEREVAAYQSVLATQSSTNLNFDNLQGRIIEIQFDNSSGSPRLQSTNLLTEMRRTEMAQLETGVTAVSLDRLRGELEKQIGNWIDGRLQLYTSISNDSARLTRLDNVGVRFLNNPTFTYHPERQSIGFDVRTTVTINGTVEVNAVNWLLNLFVNVNGTYPLSIVVNDLRLQGEAEILSPFANAGRIRFQLIPQRLGTIDVQEAGTSVPDSVKDGVREVLSHNLSARVDEIFYQDYDYFALPKISLTPAFGTTPSKLEVAYRPEANSLGPESTNPTLHLVTRAADGKLYHARKSSGGWSSYAAIPFPSPSPTPYPMIDNDPTLVHSGGGQLELAATDASGNLIYAHWRDEAWGSWQITRPNVATTPAISHRGKPAVVASAPGQVELIVPMSNGYLYHYRRLNGGWLPPVAVPIFTNFVALPLRDPAAVQIGNKVVVVYVDAQNRLFVQVFDMETNIWGSFMQITTQERISYAPAAATWSDEATDQVAVVYVGQSGTPYYIKLDVTASNLTGANPGFSYTPETAIGGALNDSPVVVASGYRQLELIGRSSDNRLYHKHFVNALAPFTVDGRTINPGWQSWSNLSENLFGTRTATDGRMSEFAAAATPTGRVELTARGYASYAYTTQYIFHNNYESNRYGSAPWKTVNWRGYEVASSQMALGRPALVAVDRNFQIGFIGNGYNPTLTPTLQYARLSASNATSFTTGGRALAAQNSIAPVVLSSGSGLTDNIYIGDDGRLHHDRLRNANVATPYTLSMPTGVSLMGPLAADSYGNGFIELAALGSDRRIYHWRYRDGSWGNPTAVANNIISAPVLRYVGAGQMELLAVDVDYRLFRWRHTGLSWASRVSLPGNFRINERLFGPTAASSWGDGTIDVAVVDRDTRELYQRRIGPGDETCSAPGCPAPRVFNKVGGSVIDKPVLTAFSPTKLNVLTMEALQWFSNWATANPVQPVTNPPQRDPALSWSGPQSMGGSEMVVGAAAHTGSTNYAVVAIGVDGRVFINRSQQGHWTGFQHVAGQTPEMILRSPVILPTLAAHGG